jgi:hypothetical protein
MQKLTAVEEAKALMNEAKDWGVWHWLLEKKRVRAAADRAVDALSEAEKKVKTSWSDDLKKAYRELEAKATFENNARAKRQYEKARDEAKDIGHDIKIAVAKVKDADDEAEAARLDAEDTFAEAERRMSSSLAREGAEKAIDSWDRREKAIRRAEALARRK